MRFLIICRFCIRTIESRENRITLVRKGESPSLVSSLCVEGKLVVEDVKVSLVDELVVEEIEDDISSVVVMMISGASIR